MDTMDKARKAEVMLELLHLSTDYVRTGELLKELVGGIYDDILNR